MEKDAGLIAERNQNEYEKNKARARKANIQFPTPIPTGFSTLINISDPNNRFSLQFSQMDHINILDDYFLSIIPPTTNHIFCRCSAKRSQFVCTSGHLQGKSCYARIKVLSFSFSLYTPRFLARRTNC